MRFQAVTLFRSELLRATRGANDRNLHVVVTHAVHVRSQHSFGLPLRMNGIHRTQFDHSWLDRSCLRWRTCRPMVEDAPRRMREKSSFTQGILILKRTDEDLFLITPFNTCWLTKVLKRGELEKRNSSFITVAGCHSFTIQSKVVSTSNKPIVLKLISSSEKRLLCI